MSRITKHIPLILLLAALLTLIIGFRAVFVQYIVEPIAILLWAAWRVVLSVNQSIYWGLLLLLSLTAVIRTFAWSRDEPATSEHAPRHESRTRIERWQALMREAGATPDRSAALRQGLTDLLASLVGQGEVSSPAELGARLRSKRIVLPPRVQRYLFPGQAKSGWRIMEWITGLPGRLPRRLRPWAGKQAAAERAQAREVLQWMESLMEISHDR